MSQRSRTGLIISLVAIVLVVGVFGWLSKAGKLKIGASVATNSKAFSYVAAPLPSQWNPRKDDPVPAGAWISPTVQVVGDQAFIFNNLTSNMGSSTNPNLAAETEVYNFKTDKWQKIAPVPGNITNLSFVRGNKIFVLGVNSSSSTCAWYVLDANTKQWQTVNLSGSDKLCSNYYLFTNGQLLGNYTNLNPSDKDSEIIVVKSSIDSSGKIDNKTSIVVYKLNIPANISPEELAKSSEGLTEYDRLRGIDVYNENRSFVLSPGGSSGDMNFTIYGLRSPLGGYTNLSYYADWGGGRKNFGIANPTPTTGDGSAFAAIYNGEYPSSKNVYAFGRAFSGYDGFYKDSPTILAKYIYRVNSGGTVAVVNLLPYQLNNASAAVYNGKIYLFGGLSNNKIPAKSLVYNPTYDNNILAGVNTMPGINSSPGINNPPVPGTNSKPGINNPPVVPGNNSLPGNKLPSSLIIIQPIYQNNTVRGVTVVGYENKGTVDSEGFITINVNKAGSYNIQVTKGGLKSAMISCQTGKPCQAPFTVVSVANTKILTGK